MGLEANLRLQPIMTDLEPALESLLKFVRCKCKLSTANPCGTNTCSCRKHGLKCVTACGDCRGESCRNAKETVYNNCDDYIISDSHFLFYNHYFHTTNIVIYNAYLMSKFCIFRDLKMPDVPKVKLGIKSFPKQDFRGF